MAWPIAGGVMEIDLFFFFFFQAMCDCAFPFLA